MEIKHVKVIQTDRLYTEIDGKPIPVDKSQREAIEQLATYEYITKLEKQTNLTYSDALKQGIDIDPSLIEVGEVCLHCGKNESCDEVCRYKPFSFLKQAKEETNEAEETQSAILQDLLDIANSNILPPHLKLKRIYEQFTLKRK